MVLRAFLELEQAANAEPLKRSYDPARFANALGALTADLRAAQEDDPSLYGPELHLQDQQAFVRVAFRLAFWELLHAGSFEAALIDVVNRGGDADTNGAICGALVGATYGVASVPDRWWRPVLTALNDDRENPLASAYHPQALLALVDNWRSLLDTG
jgi:ADP-ribosylglycohydrolase